jgi:RHS repeat-associated protein
MKLADQTLSYDVADQHLKTVSTDGTTVTYIRDVTGRVVQRTAHPVTGADDSERYTFNGGGESPFGVLDATTNARLQRFLTLPGGTTVSIDSSANRFWTYSGILGNIIFFGGTASTRYTYDPFGQVIDSSGNLGTLAADDAGPDTHIGNADNGFAGTNRKLYEHQGSISTIEMGARQYVPGLGRFLETDPITGGNTADYNYPNDPINMSDLDGTKGCSPHCNGAGSGHDYSGAWDGFVGWLGWEWDVILTDYLPAIPDGGAIAGVLGAGSKAARAATRATQAAKYAEIVEPKVTAAARGLGFRILKGEISNGQKVFTNGKRIITKDVGTSGSPH